MQAQFTEDNGLGNDYIHVIRLDLQSFLTASQLLLMQAQFTEDNGLGNDYIHVIRLDL